MNVREKLIELLDINCGYVDEVKAEVLADYLIANGVTVQEWIPVTERLPKSKERAICINDDGDMAVGTYTVWGWIFPFYFKEPTHWMPTPPEEDAR